MMGYIALFARFVGEVPALSPATRLHRFATRLCSTCSCPAMGTEAAPSLAMCYLSCAGGSRNRSALHCCACALLGYSSEHGRSTGAESCLSLTRWSSRGEAELPCRVSGPGLHRSDTEKCRFLPTYPHLLARWPERIARSPHSVARCSAPQHYLPHSSRRSMALRKEGSGYHRGLYVPALA